MRDVRILEVGPRDGLQNESLILSLEDKIQFITSLVAMGLNRIELGSFVSPKRIPQMRDTDLLVKKILEDQRQGLMAPGVEFSALVPNLKGLNRALNSGIKEISVFLSATDTFSQKNLNCSSQKAYHIYQQVCKQALRQKLKIRAYLSVCFYCPYEGEVPTQKVIDWVKKIEDLGVYEIAISDTTGKASPLQVTNLLSDLLKQVSNNKIACHFHDVHGMALANIVSAYQLGIKSFDGSVGGLGACPYAKVPSGNVPTESIIYLFKGSNPLIQKIIDLALWLEKKLNKKLPSLFLRSPYYKKS